MVVWPNGKKFAFTVIDDTDNGTVFNIKPVYDFLYEYGFKTTKTVWIYPPRDRFTGQCLQDESYRDFIYDLKGKGFEIALHNVGSGSFSREEIIKGIDGFYKIMGFYPKMQINHASNPDNIYWGVDRYTQLLRYLMGLFYGSERKYFGNDPSSKHFWGDISKKYFKYIRNHTFNGINTLKYDPKMPYKVRHKDKYSNYWFSSSDGHTIGEFNALVSPKNIMKLESQGGLCIVYTHFASGFVDKERRLNSEFKDSVEFLSKRNGWFVPASNILDYLLRNKETDSFYIPAFYGIRLDFMWVIDRLIKKIKTGR